MTAPIASDRATRRAGVRPAELVPWLLAASDATGTVIETVPVARAAETPDGGFRFEGRAEWFGGEATWRPAAGGRAWDVELEVTACAPRPIDATLAVAIRVAADRDPDWLVPGVFVGENRPAESRARYPRWVPTTELGAGDPFAATEWWFRSDRAATPAAIARGGGLRVAIATTETSPLGPTGVGFGTVADATATGSERREVRLSFPFRELPVVYDGSADPLPADRRVHRFEPGEAASLRFRVHAEPDGSEATTRILRSLASWLAAAGGGNPGPRRRDPATEEVATLAADGLLAWHHRVVDGTHVLIETAAFGRSGDGSDTEPGDRLAMHVAWLSGAPTADALVAHGLRTGRSDARDAGRRVLDAIAGHLAPCGTFWGQWTAGGGWTKGWTPGPDALHARTLGEAELFLARATARDPDEQLGWCAALDANAEFVLAAQRADGAIPSAWNGVTGQPLAWAGTAGLAWVPALVELADLVRERRPDRAARLLEAARRAGDHYASFVESGRLGGAPEDVDLGPTSEDGYVAVMAYVALARTAGDGDRARRTRWVDLAGRSADWTLAFRYTYDVTFPERSPLARIGFRTLGADVASPANQHLHAYGLICSRELVELSRLTGDPTYAGRAAETFRCFRQGIATHDGDLGGRRGMAPERWFQTRYDGEKGEIGPLSHAWCLGLLLGAAELALVTGELGEGAADG